MLHGGFSRGNGPLFGVILIPWWWCFLNGQCNYLLAIMPIFRGLYVVIFLMLCDDFIIYYETDPLFSGPC